jgi:polyisoprenoid-binding protein YceI
VPHFGTSISRGRWDRTSGRITLDRAAGQGRVEITIEMASISTGVPAFDEVLRGAEVFDVAAHPRATFVGERFVFERERLREVSGTLTLRGRAQPLTLLAQRFNCYSSPLFRREVCGGDFEARVRRSDWGVGAGPAGSPPVSDEVRLLVQVEAIRQ